VLGGFKVEQGAMNPRTRTVTKRRAGWDAVEQQRMHQQQQTGSHLAGAVN